MLDGCDLATELVREVRADAAEDRFFTNRASMDMADHVISIVVTVLVAACVCALLARAVCLTTAGYKGFTLGTYKGNHHKGACPFVVVFVFERAGR